jgi:hypothetical protein
MQGAVFWNDIYLDVDGILSIIVGQTQRFSMINAYVSK